MVPGLGFCLFFGMWENPSAPHCSPPINPVWLFSCPVWTVSLLSGVSSAHFSRDFGLGDQHVLCPLANGGSVPSGLFQKSPTKEKCLKWEAAADDEGQWATMGLTTER